MPSWLDRILGRSDKSTRLEPAAAGPDAPAVGNKPRETIAVSSDRPIPDWALHNSDILDGFRFFATLQLRTPARVLAEHGRIHRDLRSAPPEVVQEPWQGIWVPKTKSFQELGLSIGEPTESSCASDIGTVLPSQYLPFLIGVREVVENNGPPNQRRALLADFLADKAVAGWVERHGGSEKILAHFFPTFVASLPHLAADAQAALLALGANTPSAFLRLTDTELLTLKGVSAARAEKLRNYAAECPDQDEPYLDLVQR